MAASAALPGPRIRTSARVPPVSCSGGSSDPPARWPRAPGVIPRVAIADSDLVGSEIPIPIGKGPAFRRVATPPQARAGEAAGKDGAGVDASVSAGSKL